jgi:ferredoxin
MNANIVPQQHESANIPHSADCVDPENCQQCKAYVESTKVDISTFSRLLSDFQRQFGGGRE